MDLNEKIRELSNFLSRVQFQETGEQNWFRESTVLLSRDDQTVMFGGDDADTYTQIVEDIYSAVAERRPISKRAVRDAIGNVVLRVFETENKDQEQFHEYLSAQVRELKVALVEKPKRWDIRLMVEGLAPIGLPITVGHVRFEYLDTVSALVEQIGRRAKQSPSFDLNQLTGKTIATISVDAVDHEAAVEIAKRKLQTTVDSINFFASREKVGGWVFLPGDTIAQSETTIALSEIGDVHILRRRVGPIRKIPLNQIASKRGFKRISEILFNDRPTDLEERILASLQWAGRGQVEARREEAFLLYAISLESLLLGRETTSEITHQLAVRCAHLGGGPTLDAKRRVIEQITDLYRLRSRIVHSGSFQISESELAQLREYSVLSLFILIDMDPFRSYKQVKELDSWFYEQLLAGGRGQ